LHGDFFLFRLVDMDRFLQATCLFSVVETKDLSLVCEDAPSHILCSRCIYSRRTASLSRNSGFRYHHFFVNHRCEMPTYLSCVFGKSCVAASGAPESVRQGEGRMMKERGLGVSWTKLNYGKREQTWDLGNFEGSAWGGVNIMIAMNV
jgi:hypothetical protein